MNQLVIDTQIFLMGYHEFLRQCGHCFVLLKDGNVVKVYDADKTTYSHALSDALLDNEYGTFLLKEVIDDEDKTFNECQKAFDLFLAPQLLQNNN